MENQDQKQVLEKIGEKLEESITGRDVDICHRVPTKDEGKKRRNRATTLMRDVDVTITPQMLATGARAND